jgi:hypothetical protein
VSLRGEGLTWELLAEQREVRARAWALRAAGRPDRFSRALCGDAEDALGEAARFRVAHEAGAPLVPGLGAFLSYPEEFSP